MLTTTLRRIREHSPCRGGWTNLTRELGGLRKYGLDTELATERIVETNGVQDAIWCLRATVQDSGPFCTELACRFAEAVLGYFESEFPDDDRPRKAIEAARSGDAEAARRAALDALRSALLASAAAKDAARRDALSAAAALAAGAAGSALAARAAALAAGAAASAHAAHAAAQAAGAAASALADHAVFDEVLDLVRDWQLDGRPGFCLPVIRGKLLRRLEDAANDRAQESYAHCEGEGEIGKGPDATKCRHCRL